MRPRLILALMLAVIAGISLAQGERTDARDPISRARSVLLDRAGELGVASDLADLRPVDVRQGLGGEYVRFQQTIGGVPVAGADVVVALPSSAAKSQPVVESRYLRANRAARAGPQIDAASAIASAADSLGVAMRSLRGKATVDQMYIAWEGETVLVWRVLLPASDPFGTWLVDVRTDTGEVLHSVDVLRFDEGQVFDPSPPQSSGGSIPPPTDCDSSANETLLSGEYFTRQLQGIDAGQDKLKGEYVDLTAPGILGAYKVAGQADEPTRVYAYPCTDDRFEEVMIYYHVDAVQRQIQSLGFLGTAAILDRPIPAHAHYFSSCNAFYDPTNTGIHFGDGETCGWEMDAAEDADVIVHEYGHAMQDDQIPAFGFGSASAAEQAWSLGEGFGDFLTAAIFGDSCLGDWFNSNGVCLRQMANGNTYPGDFEACRSSPSEPAEPHCGGLIWGGALWDLMQALGGDQAAADVVLTLVLESHFLLSPLATFDEAASAVRQADDILFNGSHAATIDSVFAARGLSTAAAVSDFSYAYLRIDHERRGQLDVDLLVGSTANPVCSLEVYGPVPSDQGPDLVGYSVLDGTACETFLPPTPIQPWYLRVGDVGPNQVGTLEDYDIVLAGSRRCSATDTPIPIPDNGEFIYSLVDCTVVTSGLIADADGDGFDDSVEVYVGTDPDVRCGNLGWPADLLSEGLSANKLDIQDVTSFLVPVRYFGTSAGDAEFDVRWDIVPGNSGLAGTINIVDLVSLIVLRPPMLGGEKAWGQFCP